MSDDCLLFDSVLRARKELNIVCHPVVCRVSMLRNYIRCAAVGIFVDVQI